MHRAQKRYRILQVLAEARRYILRHGQIVPESLWMRTMAEVGSLSPEWWYKLAIVASSKGDTEFKTPAEGSPATDAGCRNKRRNGR